MVSNSILLVRRSGLKLSAQTTDCVHCKSIITFGNFIKYLFSYVKSHKLKLSQKAVYNVENP
jgi:hypothetical protein